MKGHKTICAKTKVHPWEAINGNHNNNNSEHDSFMQHAPFICILSLFLKNSIRDQFSLMSLPWNDNFWNLTIYLFLTCTTTSLFLLHLISCNPSPEWNHNFLRLKTKANCVWCNRSGLGLSFLFKFKVRFCGLLIIYLFFSLHAFHSINFTLNEGIGFTCLTIVPMTDDPRILQKSLFFSKIGVGYPQAFE
jgi:hypothetical protein